MIIIGGNKTNHKIIHGHASGKRTRLYEIWHAMKVRCNRVKGYCDRGIKVCDEWKTFIHFRDWAIKNGYNDSLSIDRINNDGNYEPSNCRWTTSFQQSRNKRNNIYISYGGKTQIIADWSRQLNVPAPTISKRHREGWTDEECLFGRNYRKNQLFLSFNGKKKTIKQWATDLNIKQKTIEERHRNGWSDEECLFGR